MPTAMPTADVARAFGLGTPVRDLTHVARGAMGNVFRLDTDRGPSAVKSLFWGRQGDENTNAEFQFAARDAGVALPLPLLASSGDVTIQTDDGTWWRAYEWADGSHYWTEPSELSVATQVATMLGRLHALNYDLGATVSTWFTEPLGAERIEAAIDIAVAHGWNLDERRDALLVYDAVIAVATDEPVVGCHTDTDRSNALVEDRAVVLIDWDNAGPGVAAREFANALLQWGSQGGMPDAAVVVPMVEAYRSAGGVFEPADLSVFAAGCSAWLHYMVNCCEHLADPTADAEHLAYERGALEHLERSGPTTERFERLLEMVRG